MLRFTGAIGWSLIWWSGVVFAGVQDGSYPGQTFQSICYHGVGDDVLGNYDPDEMEVSTQNLFNQFTWMREHGFTPVSVQDILDAERGLKPLPKNPVLLTFDDGLKSFYTRVYPMLKLFKYPAVAAVVVAWIESEETEVEYGGQMLKSEDFMTWEQMREMVDSGLVEIASHSYNLHRGGLGNPFGSKLPMAIVRLYDEETDTYESDAAYYQRIYTDLKMSYDAIAEKTGKPPISVAWPYGKYNQTTVEIAKSLGMTATMVLDRPQNYISDPRRPASERIGRHLMIKNPSLGEVVYGLMNPVKKEIRRMVHIDLDHVYDPDEDVLRKNIDTLLDRIRAMETQSVVLKAWSDADNDGVADGAYFPNRHLPVRADLFNFIAWQIKTRCAAEVMVSLPTTAFAFPAESKAVYLTNQSGGDGEMKRVSIFDPYSREMVLQVYEDLGKAGDFSGLIFGQDAYLAEDEDASEAAVAWYASEWGMPPDVEAIRADPKLLAEWSRLKTRFLTDFTTLLHQRAELYCSPLVRVRNVDVETMVDEESMRKYAQFYPSIVRDYEYVMVSVAPDKRREKANKRWLQQMVALAKPYDRTMWKTIFDMSAVDPRSGKPVSAETMVRRMRWVVGAGSFQLSYGPDNFLENIPDLNTIRLGISIENFAYD